VESEENQKQVFLLFPPPLEIAPRFPHSHSLDDDSFFALHKLNERSPSHYLIPLGSSFDEKMLCYSKKSVCGKKVPFDSGLHSHAPEETVYPGFRVAISAGNAVESSGS